MSYSSVTDPLAASLRQAAGYVITIGFGLLPLLFLPITGTSLGYSKTVIAISVVLVGLIFLTMAALRAGAVSVIASNTLLALWGVVGVAAVSALVSGDMTDAFLGEQFETQTVLFLSLLALVALVGANVFVNKSAVMRLYMLLAGSSVILGVFHILRLLFGAETLSLGVFTSSVSSLVGGWNDVAIFFGLAILLAVVALEQLPLPPVGRWLFGGVVIIALIMLMVVNFLLVWVSLGLVSLAVVMYTLTRDRFRAEQPLLPVSAEKKRPNVASILVAGVVFLVSALFVVGGSFLGDQIGRAFDVSFVEVRPSVEATIDVARGVYSENALFGIGPNKFNDAWRLYKDPAINTTIFWNTTFSSGNGYLSTLAVTTGAAGIVSWLLFLGVFMVTGFRTLFATTGGDKFWYFIATSSFVAAVYIWIMALVYTPGATILLLGALFTGLYATATATLLPQHTRRWSLVANRRAGFALVGAAMVVIIGTVGVLYYIGRHASAQYQYFDSISRLSQGENIDAVRQSIANAYALTGSDRFARELARYELGLMNQLLTVASPSPEQQQRFQSAVANGVNAAQLAVNEDDTDAVNWATFGTVYSVLAAAGFEGAAERAAEALTRAQTLDPQNPEFMLLEAQLWGRTGDMQLAREKANQAIRAKRDYTSALLFLAEIDIASGDTAAALQTTQAVIALEPNNPARYYQLGVLYSALDQVPEAIAAFERAVQLDQNYANARYLLALAYTSQGRVAEAVAQLEVVRDLNPSNQDVQTLINELNTGARIDLLSTPESVAEPAPTALEDSVLTTPSTVPSSDLLTPANPVPVTSELLDNGFGVAPATIPNDINPDSATPSTDLDDGE